MTWLMMIFILVVGAVIQTVIPSSGILGGAKLPILLAIVLYYALTRNMVVTLVAAFVAGFLHDVLSQIPLGHSVFCFCFAGWLASFFRNMVLVDSIFTTIIFGGSTNVLVTMFFFMMLAQDDFVFYSYKWILLKIAGALVLGMVCAPVIFYLAGWLEKLVGNVEMEQSLDGVE
ncbi:MAG: rod shape-determining protein MreD [Kiritimatiellae bacterium]|nr:rod shape-determining protein MreD [Kiritimatiellia bacterium]MDD5521336.1 rod shape-determining protein MreD [Kiritimatiellia bacterium]